MPRNVAASAMSIRASTTPSTARRSRCSTSRATAWRGSAFRRPPASSRRRARAPASSPMQWEGIEQFLQARRGDPRRARRPGRGRASGGAHARAGARDRQGTARVLAGTPMRAARARSTNPARGTRATRQRSGLRHERAGGCDIVVIGLSLSSSWGNGHATTYRALLKAWRARGHDDHCSSSAISPGMRPTATSRTRTGAGSPSTSRSRASAWTRRIAAADAVIVGSYVPEGIAVGLCAAHARGRDRLLRHRHAGHTRGACPGRLRLSRAGDPRLRPLSLLHRRARSLDDRASYGAPRARALYCSADPEAYAPLDRPPRWDLSYLGTYSADRQPALEKLLIEPARRCRSALRRRRAAISGRDRLARQCRAHRRMCRRR
jgi:hypothetical protein